MLKKIELIYLSILRVFVMILATVCLVASIILGVGVLKVFKGEPVKPKPPQISHNDIVNSLTQPTTESKSQQNTSKEQASVAVADDESEKAYYDKIADMIYGFIAKHQVEGFITNKDYFKYNLENSMKQTFRNNAYRLAYLKGLSETIEKSIVDKKFLDYVQKNSASNAIDSLIENYYVKFVTEVKKTEEEHNKNMDKYLEEKQKAIKNSYFAGGFFLGFIVIVFFATLLKIEVNLRNLEKLNSQVKE